VRENSSFAPLGLDHFSLVPTAYARGLYSVAASRLETLPCSTLNLQSEISRTHLSRALSKRDIREACARKPRPLGFQITQLPTSTM